MKSNIFLDIVFSCRLHWRAYATLFVLAFAATTLLVAPLDSAAHVGGFIGGVAGALAFLWLIAAFKVQSEELALQRNELRLQRQSIAIQAAEMRKMAHFGALAQVASMVASAVQAVKDAGNDLSKLPTEILPTEDWRTVFHSHSADDVLKASQRCLVSHGVARRFLDTLTAAATLYLQQVEGAPQQAGPAELLWTIDGDRLGKVPYVSQYAGTARLISEFMLRIERGYEVIELAMHVALGEILGEDVLKTDPVIALRTKVEGYGVQLPPIVRRSSIGKKPAATVSR